MNSPGKFTRSRYSKCNTEHCTSMRPSRFVASLTFVGVTGFLLGRCSVPGVGLPFSERAIPSIATDSLQGSAVANVIDGDTLVLNVPDAPTGQEKVRLLAIDTPERGQQWYAESRAALRALVEGRTVRLEFEGNRQARRDKYGRLLAYVFVEDRNLNVEMVRQGWSAYVSKYGGERYDRRLAEAEEQARAAHRGIWSSRP